MSTPRSAYGGQAVIEGVMIRGKEHVATACRLKDGTITVKREKASSMTERFPWLRLAFLRGTPALIDSMRLGYRTLLWAAEQQLEGEDIKKPSWWEYALTIAGALAFGIGIFKVIPNLVTHYLTGMNKVAVTGSWLTQITPTMQTIVPNIVEGLVSLVVLVLYIVLISRMPDIRRVFAYHGAEHKVVNAYEAIGIPLTVEDAKTFSRIHPRCGTSFLFLTIVVAILLHGFAGWGDNHLLRVGVRLAMLPLVAGISYELIRLAGRFRDSRFLKVLVWPGMALQRLTTAEPSAEQIDVALHSLRAVLEEEGVLPREETPVEDVAPAPLTPESSTVA